MDPIAALRPCAVDVALGDWEYTIPALPADVWLEAVLDTDGHAILPGLLGVDDQRDVLRQWLTGAVSAEDVAQAAREALGAAAGRPWWEAAKLIRGATHPAAWAVISGDLLRHGVDLAKISIGGFCNAVYSLAVANATDEQTRTRLDFEIGTPPPGVDLDELVDELTEADQFEADLADFGG